MIKQDLNTGEKFNKAASILEEVEEDQLDEEDRERFMTLFMELMDMGGKYE